MLPFSSIVCAVDFSEHSRHAIRTAAGLAARRFAPLWLVHVVDQLLAEAAATAYDEPTLRGTAEVDLRSFAATELARTPNVDPTIEVRIGRPDKEILQSARDHGADLIVLGTHGLGGFRKLFFGSVTERVLRKAVTPVLAVPIDQEHPGGPASGAPRAVLAAIDLDETALPMGLAAQQVASALDAPLTLVHAVPPVQAIGVWTVAYGEELPARIARARTSLDQIAQVVNPRRPPAVVVQSGTPAEQIAAVAASMPADLLVVVGLGGGWMLHRPGSTAYRVLSLSTVPVLGLPPEAVTALSGTRTDS
jgi:nucleotide-binding universal stress UspA family protein